MEKEGCDKIYSDKFTGTKTDWPNFNKVLQELKEGDTLVVTKLVRFARTTADGINTIKELFERGVKVHVLNMGLVEDTPTGRLILNVMLAFTELERGMIVERTQEGKAIAKQKPDFREGRPKKYSKKHIENALQLLESPLINKLRKKDRHQQKYADKGKEQQLSQIQNMGVALTNAYFIR